MQVIPFIDIDYCQFYDWGYKKPTRIWGCPQVTELESVLCDPNTCPNVVLKPDGRRKNRESLGGNHIRFNRDHKYRVPEGVVRYLCMCSNTRRIEKVIRSLKAMQFTPYTELRFQDLEDEQLMKMAEEIVSSEHSEQFVRSVVITENPIQGESVASMREKDHH